MKLIAQGAEASVYDDGDVIIKARASKSYRIAEIDERLIRVRLRMEARILERLAVLGVPAPRLIKIEGNSLHMEKIRGILAKHYINGDNHADVLYHLGQLVASIHNSDIIHGDLTTLNFIVSFDFPATKRIFIIDFGLSYNSHKDEDKAVDLYVFERALKCGHSEAYTHSFLEGYSSRGSQSVLARLESVRLRGRKREEEGG